MKLWSSWGTYCPDRTTAVIILQALFPPLSKNPWRGFQRLLAYPKVQRFTNIITYGIRLHGIRWVKFAQKNGLVPHIGLAAHGLINLRWFYNSKQSWRAHKWCWKALFRNSQQKAVLSFVDSWKVIYFWLVMYSTPNGQFSSCLLRRTLLILPTVVHTEYGNTCYSLCINRGLATLVRTLERRSTVRVSITAKMASPNVAWLSLH